MCPAARRLAILTPQNHARFEIDAAIARQQQTLELACTAPTEAPVRWTVNGRQVSTAANGRTFWLLSQGDWHIRAEAGGQSAEVEITVTGMN